MRLSSLTLSISSLALTVLLMGGCIEPEYDGIEISRISSPPKPAAAEINTDGTSFVTKGISVAISVRPLSSNSKEYQVTDDLEMVSQNENVLLVSPSYFNGVFVLTSFNTGQTCMEVIVNGKTKECIDILVVE